MRRFERQEVTQMMRVEVEAKCDLCGIAEADTEFGRLIPVAIEVDPDEEFGCRDEYDYCDGCLIIAAPALYAAGSRSSLVATPNADGTMPTYYCPGCDERHEPPLHEGGLDS